MNENSNENLSINLLGTNKDNLNKEKIITFFLILQQVKNLKFMVIKMIHLNLYYINF